MIANVKIQYNILAMQIIFKYDFEMFVIRKKQEKNKLKRPMLAKKDIREWLSINQNNGGKF